MDNDKGSRFADKDRTGDEISGLSPEQEAEHQKATEALLSSRAEAPDAAGDVTKRVDTVLSIKERHEIQEQAAGLSPEADFSFPGSNSNAVYEI